MSKKHSKLSWGKILPAPTNSVDTQKPSALLILFYYIYIYIYIGKIKNSNQY